jgi:hypothetical protein
LRQVAAVRARQNANRGDHSPAVDISGLCEQVLYLFTQAAYATNEELPHHLIEVAAVFVQWVEAIEAQAVAS